MKIVRALSLCVAAVLIILILSGCSGIKSVGKEHVGAALKYSGKDIYPIKCDDTLDFWMPLNILFSSKYTNFGDTEVAKKIEEKSGVKITYIHPPQGMENEKFNLMLASDELPDIVRADWYSYGGEKAISENFIYRLNEIMDNWAPNLKALLSQRSELDKMLKTDEGSYYVVPMVKDEPSQCVYTGPIVRYDWLCDLSLPLPETIDDWENMLRRFKIEKGAAYPLGVNFDVFKQGFLIGAWGITYGFYVGDDGTVKYGPKEPGFKDFLIKMNLWYKEGLIDNNFAGLDWKIQKSNILSGNSGATFGLASGDLGVWLSTAGGKNGFDLVGTKYPVLNKGETSDFSQRDHEYVSMAGFAISKKCINPELAMRFLDFGFSEEGKNIYNYGIENKSFIIGENGKPEFTGFILNNPDGISVQNILTEYSPASYSAPTIQEKAAQVAERTFSAQNEAVSRWEDTDEIKHQLPLIAFTNDENSKLSVFKNSIEAYCDEMTIAFIMGTKPLSEFDEFLYQLDNMKIDDVLNIYNDALKRYNNR